MDTLIVHCWDVELAALTVMCCWHICIVYHAQNSTLLVMVIIHSCLFDLSCIATAGLKSEAAAELFSLQKQAVDAHQ